MKFIIFGRQKTPGFMKFIIFEGKRPLVEIDQLPNLSHLSFFIKLTQFFIKSTKTGVFYQ